MRSSNFDAKLERGLAECKVPNEKVRKIYALTKKGKKVLEKIKEQ